MPKFGCALILSAGLALCGGAIGAPPAYLVIPAPAGLPQSSVIAMTQTRDGYLWLGTRDALARFDGNRFEDFNEWNTPGLGGNTIVHLFEDSRGGLWVGAKGGSVTFIQTGKVTTLEIPGGANGPLKSTCEDATGAVWLYLADGRLLRCRDGAVENLWLPDPTPSNYRAVIAEASGQLWLGTDTALYQVVSEVRAQPFELLLKSNSVPQQAFLLASRVGGFWQFADGKIRKVTPGTPTPVAELAASYPWGNDRILSVLEDHAGRLVVGTYANQVFRLAATGEFYRIEGLPRHAALSLWEDREDNLWVGTDGAGLIRVKQNPFRLVVPGSETNVVQSVSADSKGGLWLGYNGGGAIYWNGETIREYGPDSGLFGSGEKRAPNFSAVLVDRQQRVWVGTRDYGLYEFAGGYFQLARDPRFFGRNVSALFEDRQGNIWVGTELGLAKWDGTRWRWFNKQSGLTADRITAIAEDQAGNLWIGTERAGLNRWQNGQFSALHQADGLPSENITALYVDKDDVLWVGTGNGLARLHAGRWSHFTKKEGLASDNISYLIEDDQEHLWIGSNLGLMRLAKKSLLNQAPGKTTLLSCRVYGEREGLPTSECTQGSQPAASRTPDGRLWFPTIRGLVSVNPAELVPNTNTPLVAIESILLDDQEQNTNRLASVNAGTLIVPASVQQLVIAYTSLNLAAPERALFRYWLEGHETGWSSPTDRRSASYSKLPPGEYRFRVKASNEDGLWNMEGVTLAITVLPPFWKTWWFRTGAVLVLLGAVVGMVYFIATQKLQRQVALLRQQEALEKERARIARDLHDQLGANLTQVALLGEMVGEDKDLPNEVENHAQQICQTARTTSDALDEIVWAANPSNDTLEGLVTYACKYAQDYLALAGLRYRLDVPTDLPPGNIPPDLRHNVFLAFKESVNNVVKHAQATEVKIRLRWEADQFLFEIEDNGRGPADAAKKTGRNGLRNMRQRMEDVGGTFTMTPGPERGTIVRLTSPIAKR
jgi:ligand-binding sensor domain-containing protein/signal transduction histidine kinase